MDLIPILKKVPERWAPWKTLCKKVRTLQRELYFGLLKECEHRIANGLRNDCFMENVLDRQKEFGMSRELVGYVDLFRRSLRMLISSPYQGTLEAC